MKAKSKNNTEDNNSLKVEINQVKTQKKNSKPYKKSYLSY